MLSLTPSTLARSRLAVGMTNDVAGMQNGTRERKRVLGYHNAIDVDDLDQSPAPPPSYSSTLLARPRSNPDKFRQVDTEKETLPPYVCTVGIEQVVGIRYEFLNPFEAVEGSQWIDVYAVLRGTQLSLHQIQLPGIFNKNRGTTRTMVTAGKLIKSYTMQHAEIGIAADVKKYEMVPRSTMTSLLPESSQRKLMISEPHMFFPVRQYILRLRLESIQFIMRFKTWDDRALWIDKLCMAVDISLPLEDRTEPKYHTLPRRRRRRDPQRQPDNIVIEASSLVEEQERIIRARFPHLLGAERSSPSTEAGNPFEISSSRSGDETADPEAEDLEREVVLGTDNTGGAQENSPQQMDISDSLHNFEQQLNSAVALQDSSANQTHESTFDPSYRCTVITKLDPTPQMNEEQEARYRGRCMPALLYNSARNNDIIIQDRLRWKIDWKECCLRSYPQPPPSYCPMEILASSSGSSDQDSNPHPDSSRPVTPPEGLQLQPTHSSTTVNASADSSVKTNDDETPDETRRKGLSGLAKKLRRKSPNSEDVRIAAAYESAILHAKSTHGSAHSAVSCSNARDNRLVRTDTTLTRGSLWSLAGQ